jgi:hypothetical protein
VHFPVSKGKQRDPASRAADIVDVDVHGHDAPGIIV